MDTHVNGNFNVGTISIRSPVHRTMRTTVGMSRDGFDAFFCKIHKQADELFSFAPLLKRYNRRLVTNNVADYSCV